MAFSFTQIKSDKELQYRLQKYFWAAMVVPTLLWWRHSILWVLLMSLYANFASAGGAESAEAAKKRQGDK